MSFANPTPIRIGMNGTFKGRSYRVVGRVVLGMDDAGEMYYWHEFNLVSADGASATLVFEPTDRGGVWRWFEMFDPAFPLTAAEAASKRVGAQVKLDGTVARVTLVDESRVYEIEGQAPEGVEVGDVAHYFNAEVENRMLVLSWTGEEIECFRGEDLTRGLVMAAFGLSSEAFPSFVPPADTSTPSSGLVVKIVGAFVVLAVLLASYASCRPKRQQAVLAKTSAPASPLAVGTEGRLDGKTYRVRGHALVEIAQVGRTYDRHEYRLFDDAGARALLVYGSKPGARDWILFTPLEPLTPLTPQQAAALRVGDSINVDSSPAKVSELFQSTTRETERPDLSELKGDSLFFGFNAQSGSTTLFTRWSESGITFYRGKAVPEKAVTTAFGGKTKD